MRKYWLQFGCFLMGYNYKILIDCSENSHKKVLRNTSAILIVIFIWAFIGFSFASRYLKTSDIASVFVSFIFVIIIVQIEKQVLLSPKGNKPLMIGRTIVALAMALVGSLIFDQIIFKEDIQKQQLTNNEYEVDKILPFKAAELRNQINQLDSNIVQKENERKKLVGEISANPTIQIYERQTTTSNSLTNPDSAIARNTTRKSYQIPNPKMDLIKPLDDQIESLRADKLKKEKSLIDLRITVGEQVNSKTGFLDELKVLMQIVFGSAVAATTWSIIFLLLLGLESFVLLSNWKDVSNDYDERLESQMQLHLKRIKLLEKQVEMI